MRGREVWVTGIGLVTSLGIGVEATWNGMMEGATGMTATTSDEARIVRCPSQAQVKKFRGADFISNRKSLKLMTRQVQLGLAAARLAVEDAKLDVAKVDSEMFGVYVGAGQAFAESRELEGAFDQARREDGTFDIVAFGDKGLAFIHPLWLLRGLSNNVLGFVSLEYDAQGINNNYCNSGISSAQAILSGARSVAEGLADIVLVGGYDDILTPEGLLGYGRLGLLANGAMTAENAHRPFDRHRTGLVPAEGACFLMLEAPEHARARGATPLARVVGGGVASDGYHVTTPDPGGGKLRRAAEAALAEVGAETSDVGAVFAHGASSVRFDQVEAQVYRELFGSRIGAIPICADKANLGHTVAASAAISAAVVCKALAMGRLPHIPTLKDVDPACAGLQYLTGGPVSWTPSLTLTASAGLGGQAAVLAFAPVVA